MSTLICAYMLAASGDGGSGQRGLCGEPEFSRFRFASRPATTAQKGGREWVSSNVHDKRLSAETGPSEALTSANVSGSAAGDDAAAGAGKRGEQGCAGALCAVYLGEHGAGQHPVHDAALSRRKTGGDGDGHAPAAAEEARIPDRPRGEGVWISSNG